MSDRPLKELKDKTPLDVAYTPNMDNLAKKGICGLSRTFYEGLPYDSSVANMGVLGYDPRKYFTGRAPLEAANIGVDLAYGDIALRCNLLTVQDGRIVDFTAGHIPNKDALELMNSLGERLGGRGVEFHAGVSYRNLLVLRSDLRPSLDFTARQPHDIVGHRVDENLIQSNSKEAGATVQLLNDLMEKAGDILANHELNWRRIGEGKNPANAAWFWGAGVKPNMPLFEKVFGLKGSLVSAVDLLKGLGRIIGMRVLDVKGATGYYDTNYEGKADAALNSLADLDLAYIHVESTDEAGHEGSIEHKIKAIEDIDERVLGRIIDNIEGDYAILLMPDHSTPIVARTHTTDPVPYVIFDTRRKAEGVKAYNERDIGEKAGQRIVDSHTLMKKMTG